MFAKILHMKAKWADRRLLTADIHISRINLVIKRSGYDELLSPQTKESPPPEAIPVFHDGGLSHAPFMVSGSTLIQFSAMCFVNAVDGPVSIYLD
jgi:hypothetical protein